MSKFKKILLSLCLLVSPFLVKAQADYRSPDYHFWNQMSIGKGSGATTDPNAWLEIGVLGGTKGFILPRVNHNNLSSSSQANLIYDINSKTLWYSDGGQWYEVFTTNAAEIYNAAYNSASFNPSTRVLTLTTIDDQTTNLVISAQTLSLSGSTLSISGGNSVSLTTDNVTEGSSNLYFTPARARTTISLGNGLTYNNTTGLGTLGGSLTASTIINQGAFDLSFKNGSTTNLSILSNGTINLGTYIAHADAGFTGKVLFLDGSGNVKYGVTNFLTANQGITLSGDVTGTGATAITTTIAPSVVTYSKIQNVAASRLLGRYTASSGVTQEISLGSGLTLNTSTGVLSSAGITSETDPIFTASPSFGITSPNITNWTSAYNDKINSLAFSGTTTKTLTLTQQDGGTVTGTFTDLGITSETDPVWTAAATNYYTKTNLQTSGGATIDYHNIVTPPWLTANQTITLSGDVAGSGATSIANTIQPAVVTYAKIQNVTASRLLGRFAGTAGTTQEISVGSGLALNTSTGVLSSTGVGTETDPVFTASPSFGITSPNITNWTAAYNDKVNSLAFTGTGTKTLTLTQQDGGTVTGNFTDQGITTETDPVFGASVASGITSTNTTNWTAGYNDKINSLAFSGTATKTLTLTQQDGGTVTGTFTDQGLTSETDPVAIAKTVTLTNGTGISITGAAQTINANPTFTISNTASLQQVTNIGKTTTNDMSISAALASQFALSVANTGTTGGGIFANSTTGVPFRASLNSASKLEVLSSGRVIVNGATDDGSSALQVNGNIYASGSGTFAGGGFNSLRSLKTDIHEFSGNALSILAKIDTLYTFKYKTDLKNQYIGMVIDENSTLPKEILMNDGKAINTYSTISLLIKAIQELNAKIDTLVEQQKNSK